ncbi:MAG: M20/M25/M40 family metallo-hydrolase [Kofleriaceae bacterium]
MRKLVGAVLLAAVATVGQAEPTNNDIDKIIDQGLRHSKVMQTAEYLDDWIGGRLTNSPAMRTAETWTMKQFSAWGLKNVHKDGWEFGRGWSIVSSSVKMTEPRAMTLTAIPVAWTPGTNGTINADIVVAPMKKERDFAQYHGKLKGKIVLISLPTDGSEPAEAPFKRLTGEDIGKMDKYTFPEIDPSKIEKYIKQRLYLTQKADKFLKDEGALAVVKESYRDGKLVHGEGYRFTQGDTSLLPWIELAAEDYRRLARLAKSGANPKLSIDVQVKFDDSDTKAYNIIAEIPGTQAGTEYVMAGAHLDSWIAGDGAADNGAGSVTVMEAARILAASGVRPKRTIRFVLWAGEEQGLLGSMNYIEKYLASRGLAKPGMEEFARWSTKFPVKQLPGYKDLVAYFNIDNGSGRLHGIHAEGNVEAVPLLRDWLQPFAGMGANTVVSSPTGGTDHVFMQAVGIPAFQFIQDPLDYGSRVHHSSIDTFDHLKAEDLRQASVVLAGVLFEAANSAKTLPHMPFPTEPVPTNPFKYDDPADD